MVGAAPEPKFVGYADAGAIGVTRGVDVVGLVEIELEGVYSGTNTRRKVTHDVEGAGDALSQDIRNGKDKGRRVARNDRV